MSSLFDSQTFKRLACLTKLSFFLLALPVVAQENPVMMQYFHWYYPNNGSLWNQVHDEAVNLADRGITALWLPPAYKGATGSDVGYGVYDLYDLGEFNQKGSVRTRYGTKNEYLAAVSEAQSRDIQVFGDVVLNHKGGADATEWVTAVRVQSGNRNQEYGSDTSILAWTRFDFPGRGNTYSSFKWRWYHFDGTDWDESTSENTIFKFRGLGKAWDWEVSSENGNYDYLLYADIDFQHQDVRQELKNWGVWYVNLTGVDGFRLDAIKHIQFSYWNEWLDYVRATTGKSLFTVGEYWEYNVSDLNNYITKTNGKMSLFDAPLHLNFFNASNGGGNYDMRNIMNNTLMQQNPALAVTVVENHDTQPLQSLASPVQDWFKPLAYAFILLRQEGYPCVFYADYYGASYTDQGQTVNMASHKAIIDTLLEARRDYAYGPQNSYLDHWDQIGWTRLGDASHPDTLAVLMSDGPSGSKWMATGKANTSYFDLTGNRSDSVTTNSSGWGEFKVNGGSVSVWVEGSPASTVDVSFTCYNATTYWGQNVYVVGNIPELGSWNPAQAILLNSSAYPTWSGTIALPASTSIQWKCIKKDGNGNVVWQSGSNHNYTTPASGSGSTSTTF